MQEEITAYPNMNSKDSKKHSQTLPSPPIMVTEQKKKKEFQE
jgi:hypothetical protein